MFSARTHFTTGSNALTRAHAQLVSKGISVLDLVCSNPTALGLSWPEDRLARCLGDSRAARYAPEPFGMLQTRAAIANEFRARGYAVETQHVMLTASTSEAYAYLFKLLCDPGDRILVPVPSYPLFDVLAGLESVELVPYALAYDGQWHVADDLRALAERSGARAIVVVHPNNPTGSFCKRRELGLLEATGLPIISDEVFAEYAHRADAERLSSLLEAPRSLVFRLGGASKSLALPQLKLAWTIIHGPAALRDEAQRRLEHIADSYLSPSAVAQLALPGLLREQLHIQARILERCSTNLAYLAETLHNSALSLLDVEGGWAALIRLPALMDEEAWVLTLLEQDRVLVQPGYFFELRSGTHIVLSLLTEPAVLREGVVRLLARVACS
jgi:aspartate/methionine/tyrosine aminotransferase